MLVATWRFIKQKLSMIDQKSIFKIKTFILDLLFPKFCLGCGAEDNWLCRACEQKIVLVKTQVCPVCGKISQNGQYCAKCRFDEILVEVEGRKKPKKVKRRKSLQGIIVAAYFEEGPTRELIHNFKYNHILEIKDVLGAALLNGLRENQIFDSRTIITAVPLHFWRQARRGYNQAEVLADYVASHLKFEKNFKILKKIRWTNPQVKYGGKKRRKNLENAFVFNKNYKIANRTVLLVDDITTTGTTLEECAKVLRAAGARKVWGLVVARG